MSAALKLFCVASLGMAGTVYIVLTSAQLPASQSPATISVATNQAVAPVVASRALSTPPGAAQQSQIQIVAIPPIPTPLVSSEFSGMPAVVTPASATVLSLPRPMLVRQPRMPAGPIPGVLRLPASEGPFPAVILLHGCNGPFTGMPDWAYRLNAWGYAALMPDSMTPRGVKNVCDPADQPKVTPWDRAGDVGAAVTWLRTKPEIDPARIAVLGLSHGGGTAAILVQTPYAGMRLRAAIDYYGSCIEPRLHGSVPLLVLAGEADDWGDPAKHCREYGKELRPDQPFEIHTYPGVYHGFDGGPTTKTVYSGHVMAYDKAAAEDSFVRVRAFLDRQVR